MIRNLILSLLLFPPFISCGQVDVNYSSSELALFQQIQFNKEDLSDFKRTINKEFTQMEVSDPGYIVLDNGNNQKTGIEKINGISIKAPENDCYEMVMSYKDELNQKGYLIFISEIGYEEPSTVSILKSTDQFDILRIQKTDGINYDMENAEVIKKLMEWNKTYGIEILGADYDWVDLTLVKEIKNVGEFAKEVYKFCPDVIDQGVGDIKVLEKILKEEKRLFLWWD